MNPHSATLGGHIALAVLAWGKFFASGPPPTVLLERLLDDRWPAAPACPVCLVSEHDGFLVLYTLFISIVSVVSLCLARGCGRGVSPGPVATKKVFRPTEPEGRAERELLSVGSDVYVSRRRK